MSAILCVDRDPSTRAVLEKSLETLGHRAVHAVSADEALEILSREPIDLILADDRSTDSDIASEPGLLERLNDASVGVPIVVMTDFSTVERAVSLIRRGAADYLTKPLRIEALRLAVSNAIEVVRLRRANDEFQLRAHDRSAIVGESSALRAVMDTIAAVAPTRAAVLLEGESGTGKELFAHAIHDRSARADRPFVTVNCAAMPEGLVESTLFGHERGAFTGANERFRGAFERAHTGTLLLDEISEMRLDLQSKLLRALQEQEFERVGGGQLVRVDVRVISTTNRQLLSEVEAGRFRRDLYYRLSVVPVRAPALRERLEDLPLLVHHFVRLTADELGIVPPSVPEETIEAIRRRPWPGNIRELMNAIERAVILRQRGRISPQLFELPEPLARTLVTTPLTADDNLARAAPDEVFDLNQLAHLAIGRALQATGGNRTRAARLLGISERTLRNKLRPIPDSVRTG